MNPKNLDQYIDPKKQLRDLFKMLELRLAGYWSREPILINEQIIEPRVRCYIKNVLAIESYLNEIFFGFPYTLEEYNWALENGEIQKSREIEKYFDALPRLDINYRNLQVSQYVTVFKDVLSNHASIFNNNAAGSVRAHIQTLAHQSFGKAGSSSNSTAQVARTDIQHMTRAWLKITKLISVHIHSNEFQKQVIQQKSRLDEQQNQVIRYINSCFEVCPTLYVLCMDLGYASIVNYQAAVEANQMIIQLGINYGHLMRDWETFKARLQIDPWVIGHFEKLEYGACKGYSLFALFLLKHNSDYSEQSWVEHIGSLWKQVTNHQGVYHNCNPEFRSFAAHSVGLIKKTQKMKRAALHYWPARYATQSTLYFPITVEQQFIENMQLGKTPFKQVVEQANQSTEKVVPAPKPQMSLVEYHAKKKSKKLWTIAKNDKNTALVKRINEIEQIYGQIFFSSDDVIDKALCCKIEVFMAFIRKSRLKAFDILGYPAPEAHNLYGHATSLGKWLLDLDHAIGLDRFKQIMLKPSDFNKSTHLLMFTVALIQADCNIRWDPEIDHARNLKIVERYNELVNSIRRLLHLPIPLSSDITSQDMTLVEKAFYQRILKITPKPKKTNEVGENKRKLTITGILEKKHSDLLPVCKNAAEYIENFFQHNLLLLSFNLSLTYNNSRQFPAALFSEVLTQYIHYGKQKEPLCWMLGYIGRRVSIRKNSYWAEIIFILDADKVPDITQAREKIDQYWSDFLKEGPERVHFPIDSIGNSHIEVQDVHLDTVPRCIYENSKFFNNNFYRLDRVDQKAQQEFINTIVLYFVKVALYNPSVSKDPHESLMRGDDDTKAENKPKGVNKSKKTPKLDQFSEGIQEVQVSSSVDSTTMSDTDRLEPTSHSISDISIQTLQNFEVGKNVDSLVLSLTEELGNTVEMPLVIKNDEKNTNSDQQKRHTKVKPKSLKFKNQHRKYRKKNSPSTSYINKIEVVKKSEDIT